MWVLPVGAGTATLPVARLPTEPSDTHSHLSHHAHKHMQTTLAVCLPTVCVCVCVCVCVHILELDRYSSVTDINNIYSPSNCGLSSLVLSA